MTGPAPDTVLAHVLDDAAVGVAVIDAGLRVTYVNRCLAEIAGMPYPGEAGRSVHDAVPALARPVVKVLETGRPILSALLTGPAAVRDRQFEASCLPLDTPDGPAVGALVIDVTDRAVAAADARRRIRQQTLVADLGRRALVETAIEDLLDLVCLRVRDELDGDFTGVMFQDEDSAYLVMRAGAGWPPAAMGAVRAEAGTASQAGYSVQVNGPVVLRDPAIEDRFAISDGLLALGIRSAISTPIPGDDGPVGVFGVLSRTPAKFDDDDAAFMRSVAHVLGSALINDAHRRRTEELAAQRGRLIAQAHDAAEREQRRIATVLQDEVLQQLLSARLDLTGSEPDAADTAARAVSDAIAVVRSLTASVHPVTLAHGGLETTVRELAAVHAQRSRSQVAVNVAEEAAGVSDRLVVSLLREFLDNVERHARAERVQIFVGLDEGQLVLRVSDDGRGLPTDPSAGPGDDRLGLVYARERVEALGGSLEVGPGPLGGTTAVVLLPDRRATVGRPGHA